MSAEAWTFPSGVANARESTFFPARFFDELAALPPQEVTGRLARSWFGPAEPLADFDAVAQRRREQEFGYFERICPTSWPIDLLRVRFSVDRLREALEEVPPVAPDAESFSDSLGRLILRADRFHEELRRELLPGRNGERGGSPPAPEGMARPAASMLLDSAELAITLKVAASSGDRLLKRWAQARALTAAAGVSYRAVRLGLPRELLAAYFFRQQAPPPLLPELAQALLGDYREQTARSFYPDGCEPGGEEAYLLEVAGESRGEPFCPAVVLRYLSGYLEQERRLRLSVYISLGKIRSAGERAA
jgi:hypothetical protein